MRNLRVLLFVPLLAGCSWFPQGDAKDEINRSAYAFLSTIGKVWVPAMRTYAALPRCDSPAPQPCLDVKLYAKLYDATDAVTLCMQAATRDELSLIGFEACKAKFDAVRTEFTKIGVR